VAALRTSARPSRFKSTSQQLRGPPQERSGKELPNLRAMTLDYHGYLLSPKWPPFSG
jgi:hypothetical protein